MLIVKQRCGHLVDISEGGWKALTRPSSQSVKIVLSSKNFAQVIGFGIASKGTTNDLHIFIESKL